MIQYFLLLHFNHYCPFLRKITPLSVYIFPPRVSGENRTLALTAGRTRPVFGVAGRLSDVDVLVPGVLVPVLDPEVPDDVSVSEVVEDSALVSGVGGAAAVSFGVGGAGGAGAGAGAGVPDTADVTCGFGFGLGGTGAVTAAGTGAGIPSIIFDGMIFPGVLPITGRGGALAGLQPGGKLPVSKPWKVLYPLAPTGVGLRIELKW
jgi:hypothetical protein